MLNACATLAFVVTFKFLFIYNMHLSWDKGIKMVNFVLGKKCERWINLRHEHGTKKKSESLTGIEPMTSQTLDGHSIHWAVRTHGEQGHFNWVHMWLGCLANSEEQICAQACNILYISKYLELILKKFGRLLVRWSDIMMLALMSGWSIYQSSFNV